MQTCGGIRQRNGVAWRRSCLLVIAMMLEASPVIPSRAGGGDDSADADQVWRLSRLARAVASPSAQSLVVSVSAKFSTAVRSDGQYPTAFRIVRHGPVMLAASQAAAANASGAAAARVVRAAALQVTERARLEILRRSSCPVIGTAGMARAIVTLASGGGSKATLMQVHEATDTLASRWADGNKGGPPHAWAEPIMVGSAVLEAILESLGQGEITAEADSPHDGTLEID